MADDSTIDYMMIEIGMGDVNKAAKTVDTTTSRSNVIKFYVN